MDTLHAQMLIADSLAAEDPALFPDLWWHGAKGSLSYAFSGSPRSYSWQPEDVAAMAARWHDGRRATPADIAPFAAAHLDFLTLVSDAGLAPPDAVVHDRQRREIRAVWADEKVSVVVAEVDEAAPVVADG